MLYMHYSQFDPRRKINRIYRKCYIRIKNTGEGGIGRRRIEKAIEYAKEQNCYKVILQSGNKRTDAHKFYESTSFDGESKKALEIRLI
jgi:hypothetical protein